MGCCSPSVGACLCQANLVLPRCVDCKKKGGNALQLEMVQRYATIIVAALLMMTHVSTIPSNCLQSTHAPFLGT